MSTNHIRSKWAAVGAAIAVSLGAGGIGITQATTSTGEKPIYLPIEPCRLADTRAEFQVGPRSAPLGPNETYTLSGQGAVGDCTLPAESTALSLNVTAINATQPTFVTLFPAGGALPVASHLNPLPGQGAVPNAVNVDLSAGGEFSVYNLQGNVDIIIDVVGIYDDHTHDDRYYTQDELSGLFGWDQNLSAQVITDTPSNLGLSVVSTIPAGHTGVLEIEFNAETACYNSATTGWCRVDILVDGAVVSSADQAFDSDDDHTEGPNSWETRTVKRVTAELPAGDHTVTVQAARGFSDPTFRVDDAILTSQVHLTS